MALTYVKNTNAYVEEHLGYEADSIAIALDEGTNTVTAYPVDTDGNKVAGAANLVDKTFGNLTDAIAYYEKIALQADEGDIIRNV